MQETSFGELWATEVVNQLKVTNTLNICFRIQNDNCYFCFYPMRIEANMC